MLEATLLSEKLVSVSKEMLSLFILFVLCFPWNISRHLNVMLLLFDHIGISQNQGIVRFRRTSGNHLEMT